MHGLIMDRPLLVADIVRHVERFHGDAAVVSRLPDAGGQVHRSSYREVVSRARRVANVLDHLQIAPQTNVGTLAWNTHRHLELYYGVSAAQRVLHTVNPRLFPEQIIWIINHAEDEAVFFDVTFAPLIDGIAAQCKSVKHWVAMTTADRLPAMNHVQPLAYESLLAQVSEQYDWPTFDEREAAALCYTSGTTGNPKGVLYSHRSTIMQAAMACRM